jgi:hypothetical protein
MNERHRFARRLFVCSSLVCIAGAAQTLDGVRADGGLRNEGAREWAQKQVKNWRLIKRDARGERIWTDRYFRDVSWTEQTDQLLLALESGNESSAQPQAALIMLSERPVEQWAARALELKSARNRDEIAWLLYRLGYKQPGAEPFEYLGGKMKLDRPWTEGLGLHLDRGGAWRFQWIPSPTLMPQMKTAGGVPKALERASQPGVLVHMKELRPGLERLRNLAGEGNGGIVGALNQGTRAGFLLRHLESWLKGAAPALEPLARREAWILHYGAGRGTWAPREGTLVFIPGELPTRTKLALQLLQLNPTSKGARSRSATWKGPESRVEVQQVRGSGGVLNLYASPSGTWICDREAPLKDLIFGGPSARLGERPQWCRTAMAGSHADTEVSLWMAPSLAAGAAFESLAARRVLQHSNQQTWPNPSIAKAAPRSGALALSIGAGPTEAMLQSLLRLDDPQPMAEPELPAMASGGATLSPIQKRDYQLEVEKIRSRRSKRDALRKELAKVNDQLDLRGASLYWEGWVEAPPISDKEKAAQIEFRKLKREAPDRAARMERSGVAKLYGGFGEPGLAPSLALAIAIKPGQKAALEASITARFHQLFKGQSQKRAVGGVELHRVQTSQAFTPCWAIVNDVLVLGSDDAAVAAVAAGLQGQAPTLADLKSESFGRAQVDGAALSKHLENLLLAYLRTQHGSPWWWGEPPPESDEASAELASSFGPFLGALRGMGKVDLALDWTAGGLEARKK